MAPPRRDPRSRASQPGPIPGGARRAPQPRVGGGQPPRHPGVGPDQRSVSAPPGQRSVSGPPRQRRADEPTQLAPEVPDHRRPARRFQVLAVLVLVAGAAVGGYVAFRPSSPPASIDAGVIAVDPLPEEEVLWQTYEKQKAATAAQAEADRAAAAAAIPAAQCADYVSHRDEQVDARQRGKRVNLDNVQLGCVLMLDAGFGMDQMWCLDSLWTGESLWDHTVTNSIGAHGIPQSLPGNKMAMFGDDWETNPVTQIKWGLWYIDNRYDTPCKTWDQWYKPDGSASY